MDSSIILELLLKIEHDKKASENKSQKTSIDENHFELSRKDIDGRLGVKLKTGKCSQLLKEQLALHMAGYGEKFGSNVEYFHAPEILDKIENLESNRINGKLFNQSPLKGLLHVHHNTFASFGYSVLRNVREYWFNNRGQIRKELSANFEQIIEKYEPHGLPPILNALHAKAIMNKDLKGEWLIYAKHNGIKYYLCLANHREGSGRKESDRFIFSKKIQLTLNEFPELKSIFS